MEIFGKPPINPFLFYTGKISGYIVWLITFLFIINVPHLSRYSFGWNDTLGYFCFLLGLVIFVQAAFNLGKSVRFGLPNKATNLKTYGIYQISRNPMYLAFALWTFGSMIFIMKFCVILLGTYSTIIYHQIILAEEKFLMERFGENYLNYKKDVRRYI